MERINRFMAFISNPNKKHDHHESVLASHGASLQDHNPPETMLRRLVSIETTKQIASQGNLGTVGNESMANKAVDQRQRVAERSRLQQAGLFQHHIPHDTLVHMSVENRAVADGSRLFMDDST